jgi:hypothetical protein
LVAPLLPWLGMWGLAVEQHHERFDGTGYPHRLKGQEVSLAARIVSVADVSVVMTAPRPYKAVMSVEAEPPREKWVGMTVGVPDEVQADNGRSPIEQRRMEHVLQRNASAAFLAPRVDQADRRGSV